MLPGHTLPEDPTQAEPVLSIADYLVEEWAKKNGEELMLRSFAKFANELLGRNRPIRLEHSVDSNYILQLQDNRRVSVWPLETVAAGTVDSSGAVKI